jgi:hypothetical protein
MCCKSKIGNEGTRGSSAFEFGEDTLCFAHTNEGTSLVRMKV